MLVYRAEDEDGFGPFDDYGYDLQDALLDECGKKHNGNVRDYPTPANDAFDKGAPPYNGAACAAASLAQWCHWFPSRCAQVLKDRGFLLVVYRVPDEDVWIGTKQVVFLRDRAKRLRRLDPVTLAVRRKKAA